MRRISVILGFAAVAAISAPLAAQGNGNGGKYGRAGSGVYDRNGDGRIDSRDQVNNCSWWEVNCTNTNSRTNRTGRNSSGGWYQIGTDRNGNVIYERSTYDKKGRETLEIARRDNNGRMKIIDKQRVDNRQINGRYDTRTNRRGDRDEDDRDDDNRGGRDR